LIITPSNAAGAKVNLPAHPATKVKLLRECSNDPDKTPRGWDALGQCEIDGLAEFSAALRMHGIDAFSHWPRLNRRLLGKAKWALSRKQIENPR